MARVLHVPAWRSQFDACARAAEMLKRAGFELRHVAMQTESTYYGWPGNDRTIRLSAHRKSKPKAGLRNTVAAKITISSVMTMYQGGTLALPDSKLEGLVANAIGRYFIQSGINGPAQGGETRRAETSSGSVHEHAVSEADAPQLGSVDIIGEVG